MLAKLAGVAGKAEVSISTVSRVGRNTDYLAAPTRRKITDAIQKLDYQPNSVAHHLKYMRTYTMVHSTKVKRVKDWMASTTLPRVVRMFLLNEAIGQQEVSLLYRSR